MCVCVSLRTHSCFWINVCVSMLVTDNMHRVHCMQGGVVCLSEVKEIKRSVARYKREKERFSSGILRLSSGRAEFGFVSLSHKLFCIPSHTELAPCFIVPTALMKSIQIWECKRQ